jgi:hypothetical protein
LHQSLKRDTFQKQGYQKEIFPYICLQENTGEKNTGEEKDFCLSIFVVRQTNLQAFRQDKLQ